MTYLSKTPSGKTTMLFFVLLLLALAGFVAAKEMGQIDNVSAKRAIGIIFGLMLITTGNFIPKLIRPQWRSPQMNLAERLTGWIFVLTGITLVVALVFLPGTGVPLWTALIGLSGFLLVGIVNVWSLVSNAGYNLPDNADGGLFAIESRRNASARYATIGILHAIGWVLAMFLADEIWGDKSAIWMVLAFMIPNGFIAIKLSHKLKAA